jgi:NADH-quinone oxidoreductase E subunit
MCRKCIGACREISGHDLFSVGYRSFRSKIVFGRDEPLEAEACRDCGICIDHCPTGALSTPSSIPGDGKRASHKTTPPRGVDRADLLNLLKVAKSKEGFVSADSIDSISRTLDIPINEVYGVATFYSFLPVEPIGRHLIRICDNLPCHLKDAAMIIEAVSEELGISPGETTVDRRFSFESTNCIGACDMAPAMLVNDDLHGHLTPEKIRDVLESYT